MNIGIVGMGYVGKAVAASWLSPKHSIEFYDPAVSGSTDNIGTIVNGQPDVIFVCVPTPQTDDGSCDTSIIKNTLDALVGSYSGIIIVKSTVPPDFWKDYLKYNNLFHVPEFLVAGQAIVDYLNPKFIFVGGTINQYLVIDILKASAVKVDVPIYYTDMATASLVKYFMNTFLAAKLTMLNQFYQLSKAVGCNWKDFTEMIKLDSRMGTSHNHVPGPDGQFGYGGACFPKDVRAIISALQTNCVSAGIIEAVDIANSTFRGKHE